MSSRYIFEHDNAWYMFEHDNANIFVGGGMSRLKHVYVKHANANTAVPIFRVIEAKHFVCGTAV